jgi:uncharacterized protein YqeY
MVRVKEQKMSSALRAQMTESVKAAMRAGDALRVSTLRMMSARLKDFDIAARPKGVMEIPDAEIIAMLRGMVKSRRESEAQYRAVNRPALADKEAAEIAIIEEFLPRTLVGAALAAAVEQAIASTEAAGPKDMGKVIAALKQAHGTDLDMGVTSALVKEKLAAR